MGRLFVEYIDEDGSGIRYKCRCGCELASDKALVWEGYMGANMPALLFRQSVNIHPYGPRREENLSTGRYVLCDVACRACCTPLGWQYLEAEAADQKYKEKCMLLRQGGLDRVNRVTGTVAAAASAPNFTRGMPQQMSSTPEPTRQPSTSG